MSAGRSPNRLIRSLAAKVNRRGVPHARRQRRRVAIVGAGPAGLQAARIAAECGHDVTLFGASQRLGGKLRWEASLPGKEEYQPLLAWMERQAQGAGVKIELGQTATANDVLTIKPDTVIVATGSHQRRPDNFAGDGVSARDWRAAAGRRRKDATAVLFDMDHSAATYAVADALAQDYRRLVLLTPRQQLARNVNYCSAIGVHRRLYDANAEIVLSAEPVPCAMACSLGATFSTDGPRTSTTLAHSSGRRRVSPTMPSQSNFTTPASRFG